MEESDVSFIAFLNDCTALSAKPFEAGWWGGCLNMVNIPRDNMNKANCVLVKAGLLSVTMMTGNPLVANREQSL